MVTWMKEQTTKIVGNRAFISFLAILTGIMFLSTMLWLFPDAASNENVTRILETAIAGFMTLAGMGAQAVFNRNPQADKDGVGVDRTSKET